MSNQTRFQKAVECANFFKEDSKKTGVVLLKPEESLEIYSFYKQATQGDNTKPKPGFFSFVQKAKWNAWDGLKGMKKEEAENKYIEVIKKYMTKYGFADKVNDF